jgi:NAD+ synthase
MKFHKDILKINCEAGVERIFTFINPQVATMKCDGAVIGLSGGIDSALCAELCVRAIGKERVLGLVLPEKESSPVGVQYVAKHAQKLGLRTITVDITPALEGIGTYEKRDEAIKIIFPEYNNRYKSKIFLPPDLLTRDAFNFFTLKIEDEHGQVKSSRLDSQGMRRIVAATDTKQRTRMLHLYYYAELNNYLVCGTTNRTEAVQGFFVKYGDGGVDIEPIEHLYKTQVYQLAEYLGVIDEIIKRSPTPDTFSMEVTDEEMYFRIPYNTLDLLLYAWEHKIPAADVSNVMDLTQDQVLRAFRDFTSKYNATNYIRAVPAHLEQ